MKRMLLLIPYPMIDPVLIDIGPLPIRWYALAYIAGLVVGWAYVRRLVAQGSLWGGARARRRASIDDSSSMSRSAWSSAAGSAMCCSTIPALLRPSPRDR